MHCNRSAALICKQCTGLCDYCARVRLAAKRQKTESKSADPCGRGGSPPSRHQLPSAVKSLALITPVPTITSSPPKQLDQPSPGFNEFNLERQVVRNLDETRGVDAFLPQLRWSTNYMRRSKRGPEVLAECAGVMRHRHYSISHR